MFESPHAVIDAVRGGFAGRKVVVAGDLILDRYLWGRVERISPEAPVPVVQLDRETETAGGAANVARNLRTLGLEVELAGITGDDAGRDALLRVVQAQGIGSEGILAVGDRGTTVKTRVVGNRQQMIRIDSESTASIAQEDEACLLATMRERLDGADALVLSDYAKGVLTGGLCAALIRLARELGVPVLVDPKGRDFERYRGATLITPNRGELALATGLSGKDLDGVWRTAAALRDSLELELVVVTLSEQGMLLIGPTGRQHIPAVAREVFDVSGAGDTVIAVFAAGLAAGLSFGDTAHLANLAAGVVVAKVGTAAVCVDELDAAITGEAALEQAAKVCDRGDARELVQRWHVNGQRVVFTNGCFDLLHVGHVIYLERARRYGDRLIVGVNTDRSVSALKGPERPLIGEHERARVLAALASVDAVVLFDEDTPLDLICALQPDVLAKGADYSEEQVVGGAQVKARGGQVVLVPLVEDRSTTKIIGRINAEGEGEYQRSG